ncbi:MAG: TonB C-terminal domain-containing protein [Janthinobacterium lividum]
MTTVARLIVGILSLLASALPGHAFPVRPAVSVRVELVDDQKPADLGTYVADLSAQLQKNWETRAKMLQADPAQHRVAILELTLAEDGRIVSLRQGGASLDEAWAKIAWEATKDNSYRPLPASLKGAELTLSVRFYQ